MLPVRFQVVASVSRDRLTEVVSEELVDASSRIWGAVGGWLKGALEGAALDGGVSEVLKAGLEERLEGLREGESDSSRERDSDSELIGGPPVVVGLGGCGGVGS